jgi:hypothetical protein
MRVLIAGIAFGLICLLAGVALGPVRVLVLEPQLGATVATLCEAPLLLIVMYCSARLIDRWLSFRGQDSALFGIGLIAFCLLAGADAFVGRSIRGLSIQEQINNFSTVPGVIYGLLLLAVIFMPIIADATAPAAKRILRSDGGKSGA